MIWFAQSCAGGQDNLLNIAIIGSRSLTMTSRLQPLMDGSNIKRIKTVTKQIIEIEELREEK